MSIKSKLIQVGETNEYTLGQSFLEGLKIIQNKKSKLKIKKTENVLPLYKTGGLALKTVRKKFNLSQNEFAKLLRISSATLSTWERGISRPRFHSLLGIKSSLPVDCAELLRVENFGYCVPHHFESDNS